MTPVVTAPDRARAAAVLLTLAVTGYVTVTVWASSRLGYESWSLLVLVPLLLVVGGLLVARSQVARQDPWVLQVALLALGVKLLCGVLRYLMAWKLYDGSDAGTYHEFAVRHAEEYRALDFSSFAGVPGTGWIYVVTSAVYALTGPTMVGGYVVYAFAGFWGQWFAYLGFRHGVPHGLHRRYALLVLLLPSLAFWPSALGKDAWMQLSIGTALLGAGLVAAGRARGWAVLALGLFGAWLVRPHISGLVGVAVAGGLALRRPAVTTQLTPVARGVTLLAVAGAAAWMASVGAGFVGAESLQAADLQSALRDASGRTEQGGSEFTPVPFLSPLGPAAAALTVLFRPLPFEAHNLQSLVAASETAVLLWLTWCWRWSLWRAVKVLRENVFVAACLLGTVLFVAALSEFANFGILARQRAQLLPLFLVLLCLPAPPSRPRPPGRPT